MRDFKEIRYGINNEPVRTETNSGNAKFVQVRLSSLLISLCAWANECPASAFRLREGGAEGWRFGSACL